jgi:hypothetical protein
MKVTKTYQVSSDKKYCNKSDECPQLDSGNCMLFDGVVLDFEEEETEEEFEGETLYGTDYYFLKNSECLKEGR